MGMIIVAVSATLTGRGGPQVLRRWTVGGCLASAVALGGIACGGALADTWPLRTNVFLLGLANGSFAVAAIASMMTLANHGNANREGLRMGLWGAAQAIAFALGGFLGTVAIDVARVFIAAPAQAYALVFAAEASLFLAAAAIGLRVWAIGPDSPKCAMPRFGEIAALQVMDGR